MFGEWDKDYIKGVPGLLPVNSTCLLSLVVARDFRLKTLTDCLNI